ncbi:MAG: 5-formyltetrahydrofolate cyclo-ligase [bacterium]|nr:5-formyltetrahydrofolate cyclo-ligase [bacterium]
MSNPKLWQQYQELLSKTDFVVTYSALADEIPIEEIPNFELIKNKPKFVVPPTQKMEPKEISKKIVAAFATCTPPFRARPAPRSEVRLKGRLAQMGGLQPEACPLLFLPGQKFDITGTRHGRGFGWYDRLLAGLPNEWIRIGIATESQISHTPLIRNPWDQPADWLIGEQNQRRWKIHKFLRK